MSMFENDHYQWRETYFVLFDSARRPKLKALEKMLLQLNNRLTLANGQADGTGLVETLSVLSPDDFAALDICYLEGDEVREQVKELVREITASDPQPEQRANLDRLARCDGRFDVFHFEQLAQFGEDEDEEGGMLDPSTLLIVLQALAELTGGIAVDPQAGAML